MIQAILKIVGEAQEAGYRSFVIKVARKMGLVGYVENIPDGTVKVICEGDKKIIEQFISKIKIKTETITVEDIEVKYGDSTGEFEGKGFDIKASEKISDLYREMFQGYATSLKYFKVGWVKQDEMHQDMNKGFTLLNDTLTVFREDTKTEFQTIKTDYGRISQDLGKAVDSINRFAGSIETLAKAIAEKK